MDNILSFLLGAASFVAVLSLVVFVHEYGHYRVAKSLKVAIDKFSIGFGPKLFGWRDKSGVDWQIGAYPLGGYVKFSGDEDESSFGSQEITKEAIDKGYFYAKPVWVRAAVAAAGPIFNFLFSILVFTIFYTGFGETFQKPIVAQIMPDSAAAEAKLQVGDTILAVNGQEMRSAQDLQRTIITAGGEHLVLKIKRGETLLDLPITPKIVQRATPFGDIESQGAIGIALGGQFNSRVHVKYNPISAFERGVQKTGEIINTQFKFIGALLRGAMSPGHLSGPLGIGQSAGMVAKQSLDAVPADASFFEKAGSLGLGLIELASVLSIAIGFMNLLPLPILDGGHLVFYAIEALRGKPVSNKVQVASYKIGFACLLMLFFFATFQDLDRVGIFNGVKAITHNG